MDAMTQEETESLIAQERGRAERYFNEGKMDGYKECYYRAEGLERELRIERGEIDA